MARPLAIVGLNGDFMPFADAHISPLDRGFLFGDAIYEVIPAHEGRPLLLGAHIARLNRSLAAIGIPNPYSAAEWQEFVRELVTHNGNGTMAIYIQVSRGVESGRNHVYSQHIQPTVFAMATELDATDYADGVAAITLPDERWARCDIKTTALLPNVLARQQAADAGAIDAILIDGGYVTEGAVSSVIVIEDETLVRTPHGNEVLPGTTTDHVVAIALDAGYECREERLRIERLLAADEIWLTGATKGIAPVVQIDGHRVGSGRPGPVWTKVNTLYAKHAHD